MSRLLETLGLRWWLWLALLPASCGSGDAKTEESEGSDQENASKVVDESTPSIAVFLDDYCEGIAPALRRRASELGVSVDVREAQGRASAQWQQYESLIARGAMSVVLQPASQEVLARIREDTTRRGLNLTLLEHESEESPRVCSDLLQALIRAADRFSGQRVGPGPVRTVLVFDPGWPQRRTRLEAVLDRLELKGLVLDVVEEVALGAPGFDFRSEESDSETSRQRVLRSLGRGGRVELVLAADSRETKVVFDALEGEVSPPSLICVSDRAEALERAKADPNRFMVVVPRSIEVARTALEVAVERIRGQVFEKETLVGADLSGEAPR